MRLPSQPCQAAFYRKLPEIPPIIKIMSPKEALIYSELPAVQGCTTKIDRCKRLIL